MNADEQNKALAERVRQLEQDKLEAELLRDREQEQAEQTKLEKELAERARFKRRAYWFWAIVIGLAFLAIFFEDGINNLLRNMQNKQKVAPTAESACRGTARTYVMPFDGNTYTYKCNEATGVWAYTDRFNDPSCNLIKGNIAFESKEKIYHVKGQAYYDDTSIDLEYGERWFCSEQEAISAGWRKAYE